MEAYKQIRRDFLGACVMILLIALAQNYFNIGYDDTDSLETSERSGLRLYKDHGTGIEYISSGGNLIRRVYK